MKEYKIAKGYALVIYILSLLVAGVVALLLFSPLLASKNDSIYNIYWFLVPFCLGIIALIGMAIRVAIKGRLIIDHEKIYTTGTFSNRALLFGDIKGYRIDDKYIIVEPIENDKKKIKISKYFAGTPDMIEWLASHFKDMDSYDSEQERQAILDNNKFGLTIEQREQRLKRANVVAKVVNWVGGTIGVWVMIIPKPYEYAIIASIAVPVICMAVIKYFKGLIQILQKKQTAYPSLFWAFILSGMGILIRILSDVQIFDYSNVWIPSILVTIVMTALIFAGTNHLQQVKDYFTIFFFSLIILGYAYGAVVALNCLYDQSDIQTFGAGILNKREVTGKSTKRYFRLTPWGPQQKIEEVAVSRRMYEHMNINDSVTIHLQEGRFHIPWFKLSNPRSE